MVRLLTTKSAGIYSDRWNCSRIGVTLSLMNTPSVNFQLWKLLRVTALGWLLLIGAEPARAASTSSLQQLTAECLACEHTAQVLEQEIAGWPDELVSQGRGQLQARLDRVQTCRDKGRDDLDKGETLWRERWQKAHRRSRLSNALLRQAAMRSTVRKLLHRTQTRISKIKSRIEGVEP